MILVWIVSILMIGGIVSLISGQWSKTLPRIISLLTLLAAFIAVLFIWLQYDPGTDADQLSWFIEFKADWIPSFGISFILAVDGLSIVLLLLTFFLGSLAVLCSWKEIQERVGFFHFNLLWTLAGIAGVFMAMDLFLFYFFWEVMLIPMYFLIGIWGSERREYAAFKFFIFTQVGGLLMFLAILGLFFIHYEQTGVYTFNYAELLNTGLSVVNGMLLMLGFLVAFTIKLPVIPFHTWLPDAHGEAPTAGSLILAGLLLKTGAYGIMRFALPLFPDAAFSIAPWAMALGVSGIIYGAIMAYSQTDLKRLIAYTSVSHMGFVMVGVFSFNELAFQGVVMQLVTHGISTGALFILAGMLKERLHTRDIGKMGGLWTQMPRLGTVGLFFAMASLGLPGLGSFIAEFLILLGAFQMNIFLTVLATLGLIFSAIYSLRIVQKVFLGPSLVQEVIPDFSAREIITMGVLTLAILWLGLYPQPVLNTSKAMIHKLEKQVTAHKVSDPTELVTMNLKDNYNKK